MVPFTSVASTILFISLFDRFRTVEYILYLETGTFWKRQMDQQNTIGNCMYQSMCKRQEHNALERKNIFSLWKTMTKLRESSTLNYTPLYKMAQNKTRIDQWRLLPHSNKKSQTKFTFSHFFTIHQAYARICICDLVPWTSQI